jgi:hypothetical protein
MLGPITRRSILCARAKHARCSHAFLKRWPFLRHPRGSVKFCDPPLNQSVCKKKKQPLNRQSTPAMESGDTGLRLTQKRAGDDPYWRQDHVPIPLYRAQPLSAAGPLLHCQDHGAPPPLLRNAVDDPYSRPSAAGDGCFPVIGPVPRCPSSSSQECRRRPVQPPSAAGCFQVIGLIRMSY